MSGLRRIFITCLILIGAVTVSGCTRRAPVDGKPIVVASIWPLADLTRQIVGEAAEVECLVPAGRSPHGYEPTVNNAEAVAKAKLIVTVGLHFDDWAERAARASGRDEPPLLVFADAVGVEGEEAEQEHEDEHEHEHEHEHGAVNPHLWLDPVLARQFVGQLGQRLAELLPDAREEIERNAASLTAELAALDGDYREALSPHAGGKIVTFHNAFDRLAERYGLVVAATLKPMEGPGDATRQRLEEAIEVIETHGLTAVFTEPQFSERALGNITRQTGARVLVLDPLGGPHVPDRASYQQLMRYNLATLLAGLPGAGQ